LENLIYETGWRGKNYGEIARDKIVGKSGDLPGSQKVV
jgi:hypothetical protein